MTETPTRATPRRSLDPEWLLWLLLVAVVSGHLVTLSGPGVMTPDSYAYVGMAESARAGSGFVLDGRSMRWPPGYPAVLAALMSLGAGARVSFLVLNFACLGAGLAILLARLAKRGLARPGRLVVALLALLSLPVLYSATFILSECLFFLGVVVTIELLERAREATEGRRALRLALPLISLLLTSLVRTVGLILLPAFLLTAFGPRREQNAPGRRWLALGVAALIGLLVALWADATVLKTGYFAESRSYFERIVKADGVINAFQLESRRRLSGIGECVLNLEVKGLEPFQAIFQAAGAAGLALLALTIATGRNGLGPIEAFLVSYVGMMLVFPAFGHRFWLPVVPLALGLVAHRVAAHSNAMTRVLGVVYVVCFCALGARVLGWHVESVFRAPQSHGEWLQHVRPSLD